ncbi:unnamed protein product [Linum trigynum]|uniref:Transmembrane protein n=1 Tax=Linum trigynum TaxID=586398 RepID=A0AAV2FIS5_9ROSI
MERTHFKLMLCIVILVFSVSGGKNSGAEGRNFEIDTCHSVDQCGPRRCCECVFHCVCTCSKQDMDAERLVLDSRGHEDVEGKGN